jgi:3-phosphoshikimate 1-carboxyvinyltransferase
MKGLLEALGALGAEWDTPQKSHCPPVDLSPPAEPGTGWRHTPSVELDPTESSQQLSALLMVGCRLGAGLDLEVCGPVPSAPYVDLTLEVMNRFGGQAQRTDRGFVTSPSGYRATRYRVEGDCSSASYVWAAGALTGRAVRVCNVRPDSLQGDQVFPELLDRLERDGPCTLDLGSTPDIAPTVATCALFREHLTTITNVSHLRVKECDRLAVLAAELRKMGASIEETDDGWRIEPASLSGPAVCDPRGDHRMAMCFGLASLRVDGIQINDPDCVSKSYPGYWDMLEVFK